MKFAILAAAALACLTPAAVFAQTAPAATAPAATAPTAPAATAPAAKFNLDTPIEALVAEPAALAVLAANGLGELPSHPSYEMFKGMSLRQVQPYSEGKITDEGLVKVETGLAAIK